VQFLLTKAGVASNKGFVEEELHLILNKGEGQFPLPLAGVPLEQRLASGETTLILISK